jgi:virginiamycin A acetyltransferase
MYSGLKRKLKSLIQQSNSTSKEKQDTNIVNSQITNPELISPKAKIIDSTVSGKVLLGENSFIENGTVCGNVDIATYTSINGPNTDIYAVKTYVKIGSFCSIARNVSIQEYNHMYQRCTSYFILHHIFKEDYNDEVESKGPIIIENDVWIGTHCVILSGVTINNGAVIAANSVVNTDIPAYAIAGGSPAKVIGYRFSEEIRNELLRLQWWNWPLSKIMKNRPLFEGNLTIEKIRNIVN